MIEVTDEMLEAFVASGVDGSEFLLADIRSGLVAVLAIVEREYDVALRPCQWCGTPPGHHYLSTGCLHGEHGYCKAPTGAVGGKVPATCKFCHAPCVCACHREQP